MGLGKAPGIWVWRLRDSGWWRHHEVLNIWNGPFTTDEALLIVITGERIA